MGDNVTLSYCVKNRSRKKDVGDAMHRLVSRLYPICRSITGDGVRRTLEILKHHIPLSVNEVPTGTKVFDWVVPREWNISGAYLKDPKGVRVVDFESHNLHVVNYSVPVSKKLSLEELKPHLHTLSDHPDWIPYRTSYYQENWGFCLSHNQFMGLTEGEYEVCIDSSLGPGSLTYGEYLLKGRTAEEVLVSTHICHPSLGNDNLSGVALATFLADAISNHPHKYSYRFLFVPGTIGSITWLALNEHRLPAIKHGLVAACVGDQGHLTYKKSRRGTADIDRAVQLALKDAAVEHAIEEFFPYGYDERQYCSPGINLPVGCLMRTPHGQYAEYHTSADNLDLVRPESLLDSLETYLSIFYILENDATYVNLNPKCEPQLGSRGLYSQMGGDPDSGTRQMAMLWVLNMSDGAHSLMDIAERAGIRFDFIKTAADMLVEHELLKAIDCQPGK
jgi:aminopeptidase-like protein